MSNEVEFVVLLLLRVIGDRFRRRIKTWPIANRTQSSKNNFNNKKKRKEKPIKNDHVKENERMKETSSSVSFQRWAQEQETTKMQRLKKL